MGKDQRKNETAGDAGAKTSSIEASASPSSFKATAVAECHCAIMGKPIAVSTF